MTFRRRDYDAWVLPETPAAAPPAAAESQPPSSPPPPQGPHWLGGKAPETYLYEQAVARAFRKPLPAPEDGWATDFIWGE